LFSSPTAVTVPADGRYRVDARRLPFTPSWFWEVIDTSGNAIVENSLALSRTVYQSPTEALAAGQDYLGRHEPNGAFLPAASQDRMAPAKPALERRAA
jgi:hypothetical protein